VFELQLPEVNEEFVKTLGMSTVEELRTKIKENITQEATQKADEAAEIEMLDKLVDAGSFTEVPEILVNEEIRRMIGELQQGVEQQGMKWADYLSSIKKDEGSLKLEFVPQALRRIKTAVLIKALAKEAKIEVKDAEVDEEIDHILENMRTKDQETIQRVSSPEYREYVLVQMRNRRTLEWVKEQCIKQA
jgi:trigger factor